MGTLLLDEDITQVISSLVLVLVFSRIQQATRSCCFLLEVENLGLLAAPLLPDIMEVTACTKASSSASKVVLIVSTSQSSPAEHSMLVSSGGKDMVRLIVPAMLLLLARSSSVEQQKTFIEVSQQLPAGFVRVPARSSGFVRVPARSRARSSGTNTPHL